MGYVWLSASQSQLLFDLVTARYEQGAIILTSNRSFAEWGTLLGDEVLATALLDRLLHHAEGMTLGVLRQIVHQRRRQRRGLSCCPAIPVSGAR